MVSRRGECSVLGVGALEKLGGEEEYPLRRRNATNSWSVSLPNDKCPVTEYLRRRPYEKTSITLSRPSVRGEK